MNPSTPSSAAAVRGSGRLLAVLLVAPFLAQADAAIANVATPSIHDELGASGAALELVVGGYLIAFALLLITGARLGQSVGHRRLYLTGLAAFGVASLGCGLAVSPVMLIAARAVQGAGAALMFPQSLTSIQLMFEGERRVRAIAAYAAALSIGAVAGQIAGGGLVSADLFGTGWRPIFLVNVPVVALALAAAHRVMPADAPQVRSRLDGLGVLTLSAATLLIVVPLALGRVEGWPLWAWLCLAAALPAAAGFVAVERRVAARGGAPLVELSVVSAPRVAWGLACYMCATATYVALLFVLAQYLQQGLGHSPLVSGLTLVPWVAAFGAAGQFVRRLPARQRVRAPLAGTLTLTIAYAALAALLLAGRHPEGALLALMALGGFGLGVNFGAIVAHLTGSVDPAHAADISGVSATIGQLGGAIAVAGFGTLYLGLAGTGATAAAASHGFGIVCAGFAAAALLAAVAARRATVDRAAVTAP